IRGCTTAGTRTSRACGAARTPRTRSGSIRTTWPPASSAPAAARLWSEHGAIEVEVEADPGLVRGVVALAHGGGHARASGLRVAQAAPGVNPNVLLPTGPGSFERLSNQAFMPGVPVELEALPGE